MNTTSPRLALCVPVVRPGDPAFNAARMLEQVAEATRGGATILLFPRLCISGATCGETALRNPDLLAAAEAALARIREAVCQTDATVLVSAPAIVEGKSGVAYHWISAPFEKREFRPFETERPCAECAPIRFPDETLRLSVFLSDPFDTVESILTENAPAEGADGICAFLAPGVHESTAQGIHIGRAIVRIGGGVVARGEPFSREGTILFYEIPDSGTRPASLPPDPVTAAQRAWETHRTTSPFPYVPEDDALRAAHCEIASAMQAHALATRLERMGAKRMVLGVSGGLDSAAALLACVHAADRLGLPHAAILAVTMPGFGTTDRTKSNALALAEALGAETRTIPIGDAVLRHLADIGHDPAKRDIVYENAQARMRTLILMDLANAENAPVVGTGDLSEIALGWCTYNGDQMSMYAVNAGLPKTYLRALLRQEADRAPAAVAAVLRDIVATPVSPELLPGAQITEDILGAYELHDFFLWHFLRGERRTTIRQAALAAFGAAREAEIDRAAAVFFRRLLPSEFKRKAAPDAPSILDTDFARRNWDAPSDLSNAFLTKSVDPEPDPKTP